MIERAIEQGQDPSKIPILANMPEIFPDVQHVWEGFSQLSSGRQMGMGGPQPLTLGDIREYMTYKGVDDPDDQDEFLQLIQALDFIFIKDTYAKIKAASSKK